MRWIERFDLFLLDFDGLLVNTEQLHYEAYQTLCKNLGLNLPWDFSQYLQIAHLSSDGIRKAIYTIFPHLKEEDWQELYLEKKKLYVDILKKQKLALMPGVEALLKELARMQIKRCVVTHSPKEQVEWVKSFLPILKTIPVWITREDYIEPKPSSEGYQKAIALLGEPGDRIIGFEDSVRGLQALQGTAAIPMLICDAAHPQLQEPAVRQAFHYSSLEKIPASFRGL